MWVNHDLDARDEYTDMYQIDWVKQTRETIIEYLKNTFEGAFYNRMVETVLSRDKNWVRWKIENCPPISLPSISPEEYISAKNQAKRSTANKRLRPKPMGALELSFLTESEGLGSLVTLKDPSKYELPSIDSFKEKIAKDDFEIEMPDSAESKEAAESGKASKSWRALRIASKTKLVSFDKIEDPQNIDVIFEDTPLEAEAAKENGHDIAEDTTSVAIDGSSEMDVDGASEEVNSDARAAHGEGAKSGKAEMVVDPLVDDNSPHATAVETEAKVEDVAT